MSKQLRKANCVLCRKVGSWDGLYNSNRKLTTRLKSHISRIRNADIGSNLSKPTNNQSQKRSFMKQIITLLIITYQLFVPYFILLIFLIFVG